jgi:hypothetical protein
MKDQEIYLDNIACPYHMCPNHNTIYESSRNRCSNYGVSWYKRNTSYHVDVNDARASMAVKKKQIKGRGVESVNKFLIQHHEPSFDERFITDHL